MTITLVTIYMILVVQLLVYPLEVEAVPYSDDLRVKRVSAEDHYQFATHRPFSESTNGYVSRRMRDKSNDEDEEHYRRHTGHVSNGIDSNRNHIENGVSSEYSRMYNQPADDYSKKVIEEYDQGYDKNWRDKRHETRQYQNHLENKMDTTLRSSLPHSYPEHRHTNGLVTSLLRFFGFVPTTETVAVTRPSQYEMETLAAPTVSATPSASPSAMGALESEKDEGKVSEEEENELTDKELLEMVHTMKRMFEEIERKVEEGMPNVSRTLEEAHRLNIEREREREYREKIITGKENWQREESIPVSAPAYGTSRRAGINSVRVSANWDSRSADDDEE